jgi:hypothetical protein
MNSGLMVAPDKPTRGRKRKLVVSVLLVSLVIHGLAGLGAAVWVVVKYFQPPEAVFSAKKIVTIPPKIIDPKMASGELEASSPRPVLNEKIASIRPTDFALPDLPTIPTDQVMQFDPTASMMSANGFGGQGNGRGGGSGNGAEKIDLALNAISFFGLETKGRSVVILFDISQSVLTKAQKSGVPIEKIRDETSKLINAISINTSFGLIQFSRNYQPFKKELVAPTDENKQAAQQWLQTEFRTTGSLGGSGVVYTRPNGIELVMEQAFKMQPDVIYVVSDCDFQRTLQNGEGENVSLENLDKEIKQWQSAREEPVKIYFITFQMKSAQAAMIRQIASHNHGRVKEL